MDRLAIYNILAKICIVITHDACTSVASEFFYSDSFD